jgi:HAD superfamily hydrolase (TIGR01459 family)
VLEQFGRFGVDHGAFDDIVTSGEAARDFLAARPGTRLLHVGTERDLPIYDGLDLEIVGEDDADLVSCTGLYDDETETPDDYAERLKRWKARGLPMLCANPDKVVERGHRLIWCAGAIAERYAALGGETTIVGKPFRPIYQTAMARFETITGGPVDKRSVIAIGDALETDLRGAAGFGLDALFITAGIHAEAYGAREEPDAGKVGAALLDAGVSARAFMPHLTW